MGFLFQQLLWGAPAVCPAQFTLPLRPSGPFLAWCSRCAPHSEGGPRPAILEGLFLSVPLPHILAKKGCWESWCYQLLFLPLPLCLSPTEKAVCATSFLFPQGKQLTWHSAPSSFPTGVAAMFSEHKMATRGLYLSPRNWGQHESSRMRPAVTPNPRAVVGAFPPSEFFNHFDKTIHRMVQISGG